jgi:hypothetical protein
VSGVPGWVDVSDAVAIVAAVRAGVVRAAVGAAAGDALPLNDATVTGLTLFLMWRRKR